MILAPPLPEVTRAAKFLDEHVDQWWDRINLTTLDLCDTQFCILGQLYGLYGSGVSRLLRLGWPDYKSFNAFVCEPWPTLPGQVFGGRSLAWIAAIEQRRQEDYQRRLAIG